MNKQRNIILIGNGFDLSHDLKTTYNDFLNWYLSRILDQVKITRCFEDESWRIHLQNETESFISSLNIDSLIKGNRSPGIKCLNKYIDLIAELNDPLWADLEGMYYKKLRRLAETILEQKSDSRKTNQVNELNSGFEYIKNKLIDYLIEVESNDSKERNLLLSSILNNCCHKDKHDALIINFNYTNTAERYRNIIGDGNRILNFHGSLKEQQMNPIIFGYGDTQDDHYKDLENLDDYRFIYYAKPIAYTSSDNYSFLNYWIKRGGTTIFNVHLIGLSCGITDRVLLNTIVEHDRCNEITLYYYKDRENFYRTSANLSRAFKDKKLYNSKMVPFSEQLKYSG